MNAVESIAVVLDEGVFTVLLEADVAVGVCEDGSTPLVACCVEAGAV